MYIYFHGWLVYATWTKRMCVTIWVISISVWKEQPATSVTVAKCYSAALLCAEGGSLSEIMKHMQLCDCALLSRGGSSLGCISPCDTNCGGQCWTQIAAGEKRRKKKTFHMFVIRTEWKEKKRFLLQHETQSDCSFKLDQDTIINKNNSKSYLKKIVCPAFKCTTEKCILSV